MKTLDELRATYDAMTNPGAAARYLGSVRAACMRSKWPVPDWAAAKPKRVTPAELPPAEPLALAPGLRAWRAAGVGRIVSRAFNGSITLYDWPDGKPVYARFRSEAAAIEALEAGAIEWTRKNRTAPRGFAARAVACER